LETACPAQTAGIVRSANYIGSQAREYPDSHALGEPLALSGGILCGVSPRDEVEAVYGVVAQAMWQPGGIVQMLSPTWRDKLSRTWIFVDDAPTDTERNWVDAPAPDLLMGLFTEPEDGTYVIQLFATELRRGRRDPVDALLHEMGHWDYDHGETCPECNSLARRKRPHVHRDGCPVCELFGETTLAMGLLESLRMRAHMRHAIPLGGGGVIPEARHHLGRAQLLIAPAKAIADRQLVARCEQLLADAQEALEGWLDVDAVGDAYAAARVAWDAAGDVTYGYFARVRELTG